MARKTGNGAGRGKNKTHPSTSSPTSAPDLPPPVAVLTEDALRDILRRLSLADLLRAARCLPRVPPLLGYFFHPTAPGAPPPIPFSKHIDTPAVFSPLDASAPRLSLDFAPDASRFQLYDCHHGLLLLQPTVALPKGILPHFLVLDPATQRRALLPPPPRDTVPDDRRWRRSRHYVGSALLSRAHPSRRLCFEVVCFAIDDGHPRAWVASFDDGACRWRALPRDEDVEVDFHAWWFEGRCVHAAGKIYWHICNSSRLLVLDPATLKFSYLPVPAVVGDTFCKYRIGEMPEDGRLCMVAEERGETQLQLWVLGEGWWSDNGWLLERELMDMREVYDAVPGLPRDTMKRIMSIWPSDMDAGRTGKVFIRTWGYGRYSFHPETGKLERLSTEGGKDYGHPIYAYFLAWPLAFLADRESGTSDS